MNIPPSFFELDPKPMDGDLFAAVASEERPGSTSKPWLYSNMISSADGAVSLDGLSGPLGGPPDGAMLVAMRSVADIILVGSTSVAAEEYGPPGLRPHLINERVARGQDRLPKIAIVSGRLSLAPSSSIFSDPTYRPIVITSNSAPTDRLGAIQEVADVIIAGEQSVDLTQAVAHLAQRGASRILSEGGPTLNGHLLAADLLDEWNVTISPLLVGGSAPRGAVSGLNHPARRFDGTRAWSSGGLLFLRFVRHR